MLNTLKKIISSKGDYIWMLLAQATNLLLNVSLAFAIAKTLGPSAYGVFSFALIIYGLSSIVTLFGLETNLVKNIIEEKFTSPLLFAVSLRFMAWFFSLLVFIIFMKFGLPEDLIDYKTIFYIVLGISFLDIFQVFSIHLEAKKSFKYIAGTKILISIIVALFKVTALLNTSSIYIYVLIFGLERILYTIGWIYIYYAKYYTKKNNLNISAKELIVNIKILFIESYPIFLGALFIFMYTKIDQILVIFFLGLSSLGIYSLVVKVVEALYFIPAILGNVLMPDLVANKNSMQIQDYHEYIARKASVFFWISIPLAFLVVLVSYVISLYLGQDYIEFYSLILIYTLVLPASFLANLTKKILIADNKGWVFLQRSFFGFILNLIFGYLLIPFFGVKAAAWSTVICFWYVGLISNLISSGSRYVFYAQIKGIRAPFFMATKE
tara:strand:- start:13674 stop:14987 length:1314 start_codon:yes stop_codon:yes gene_type:complete